MRISWIENVGFLMTSDVELSLGIPYLLTSCYKDSLPEQIV